jgi:chromosome segregation ATPase
MLTPADTFMKLLHIGNDRELSDRLANALKKAAQDVTVDWVGRAADATRRISDRPDVGAVIIEDAVQHQGGAGLVRDVRGLGFTEPIVVVATTGAAPPLAALKAGADDYVVQGPSMLPDLVSMVIRWRHRASGLTARRPLRCLYLGDAALARDCFREGPHAAEIVVPGPESAGNLNPVPVDAPGPGQRLPFDVVLAEHGRPGVDVFAILKDVAARRLQVPVVFIVEWDEELIVPALRMGAVDYALKTRESLRALSFRIDRARSGSVLLKEFSALLDEQAGLRASLQDTTTARAALEAKLSNAEEAIRSASARESDLAAAAAELQAQQAEVHAALARTIEARDAIARQLEDATSALDDAQQARATEAAATDLLARREAELVAKLDAESAARNTLWQELNESERRASDERQAAALEHSKQREAFDAQLLEEFAARDAIERRLTEASAAIEEASRARIADAAAAAERLSHREEELSAAIAGAEAAREVLERRLDAAEAAAHEAAERAKEDREALLNAAAQRQSEAETRLVREAASRKAVEDRLRDAEDVIRTAAEQLAALTDAVAELKEQRAKLVNELALVQTARRQLEEDLRDAEQRASADREAWALAASAREVDFEARLAKDAAVRHALEQTVSETEEAFRQAIERSATERASLEQQLHDVSLALDETREARASEGAEAAERLAKRESELTRAIGDLTAKRTALEAQLTALETAFRQTEQQAADDRQAAEHEASNRKAEFEKRQRRDAAARQTLEENVASLDAMLNDAAERHAADVEKAASQAADHQKQLEARAAELSSTRATLQQEVDDVSAALEYERLARARDVADAADRLSRCETELTATIEHMTSLLKVAERRLAETEMALQQRIREASDERLAAVEEALRRQTEFETQLAQEQDRREAGERAAAAADDALRQAVERHSAEIAVEVTRFAAYRAESEAKLSETTAARDTLAQQLNDVARELDETKQSWALDTTAAAERLTKSEGELTATLAKATALREAAESLVAERDAQLRALVISHAAAQEALQTGAANRIANLRRQLDETLVTHRTEFERLPSNLLRCSRDGAIEQVNEAMAAMLGYRGVREAEGVDFVSDVFETPDEWRALLDRCTNADSTQTCETTLKRKDGARVAVRLLAVRNTVGQIDVVAEDLTGYRQLEENLRRSQRMEAVGRLASEVAATCDTLLRDVSQDTQAWLASVGDDSRARQRGELLLHDVTRAAGFLRQLDVYGRKEAKSLEPVDLSRAVRNLSSVLKRVAGSDVELVLPKRSSSLNVDVEQDRVERIFVTVAAYARARMPFGGRVTFEYGDVMVGKDAAVEHPEVRPGPHVLITVTAVRYASWADASRTLPRLSLVKSEPESTGDDQLGVDLSAIQTLIRGCGGQLWLAAEPPGDMVLKIHLPRVLSDHAAVPSRTIPRQMRRWLYASR